MAALQRQPEVTVCRACVRWLREQTGAIDSTPILPVRYMDEAIEFYEAAGFEVRVHEGGDYGFVNHDDESVFDLGHKEGLNVESSRAGCYLIVPDPMSVTPASRHSAIPSHRSDTRTTGCASSLLPTRAATTSIRSLDSGRVIRSNRGRGVDVGRSSIGGRPRPVHTGRHVARGSS